MTYAETIQYLYEAAPLFQQIGGAAYKDGLENTLTLDRHYGHPHRHYATIHIAGTNGKGSCAHTIAAILQASGLRVGLYTSPHLVDFRERIRINGEMIPQDYVVDFVAQERAFFEPLRPSFFEITTALAFRYFKDAQVDVAVVETGLGGRLDCTNIISPILSLITNISFDHTQFLGDTLAAIAREKAGIIKPHTPAVVSEFTAETRPVFAAKAAEEAAPITFAADLPEVVGLERGQDGRALYHTRHYGDLHVELCGDCQRHNTNAVLHALPILSRHFTIPIEAIREGFARVCELTGLQGRWQTLQTHPLLICDTGHNPGGWQYLSHQLSEAAQQHRKLHIVFGMAADKAVDSVLSTLPSEAEYYFTAASVRRAMPASEVAQRAAVYGLKGNMYANVAAACQSALQAADRDDMVFVGGSCFVVADFLTAWQAHRLSARRHR